MSTRDRVTLHRERMREQGLRPIQLWVPDTRNPAFATEAHRQSQLIANDPDSDEVQGMLDSIPDDFGDDW